MWRRTTLFFCFGFLCLGILPILAKTQKEKDEEEEEEENLILDFLVGVGIRLCQEHPTCRVYMVYTAAAFLTIFLVACIFAYLCGGEDCRRSMWDAVPSARQITRSTMVSGAGYTATHYALERRKQK